jgi:hypothetical protein
VRGPDKKCTVVETEPSATQTTVTRVGKDVYVTREEAESDMAVVCKWVLAVRCDSSIST